MSSFYLFFSCFRSMIKFKAKIVWTIIHLPSLRLSGIWTHDSLDQRCLILKPLDQSSRLNFLTFHIIGWRQPKQFDDNMFFNSILLQRSNWGFQHNLLRKHAGPVIVLAKQGNYIAQNIVLILILLEFGLKTRKRLYVWHCFQIWV